MVTRPAQIRLQGRSRPLAETAHGVARDRHTAAAFDDDEVASQCARQLEERRLRESRRAPAAGATFDSAAAADAGAGAAAVGS
jgi:hypothetical protein